LAIYIQRVTAPTTRRWYNIARTALWLIIRLDNQNW